VVARRISLSRLGKLSRSFSGEHFPRLSHVLQLLLVLWIPHLVGHSPAFGRMLHIFRDFAHPSLSFDCLRRHAAAHRAYLNLKFL
jgi:hypothetical protein